MVSCFCSDEEEKQSLEVPLKKNGKPRNFKVSVSSPWLSLTPEVMALCCVVVAFYVLAGNWQG